MEIFSMLMYGGYICIEYIVIFIIYISLLLFKVGNIGDDEIEIIEFI